MRPQAVSQRRPLQIYATLKHVASKVTNCEVTTTGRGLRADVGLLGVCLPQMYDRQLSPEFLHANPELKRLVNGPEDTPDCTWDNPPGAYCD